MKGIVYVEQFFYPESWGGAQLPQDITKYLASAGCKVEVVCGSNRYVADQEDVGTDPRTVGVIIRRVPAVFGGTAERRKFLKQIAFYLMCIPALIFRRSPGLFITQTNPPLIVPIVALAARMHRCPLVIIAQDLYPEVLFAQGMLRTRSLLGRLLAIIFRWAYRQASYVVSVGELMGHRLIKKGVRRERIRVISNWATGDLGSDISDYSALRKHWGLEGKFVVLYTGNLGIAHDMDTPVSALGLMAAKIANVRLLIVGRGARLAATMQAAESIGVGGAVQIRPPVSSGRLTQTLGLADIALVSLRDGFEGLVVPSKLLGYMARGKATLYVGPNSDVEKILSRSGGGRCFRNGDALGLCREIQGLMENPKRIAEMGAAAEKYYRDHLSQAVGLQKYGRLIDLALEGKRVPGDALEG